MREDIARAVALLRAGELVGFPTETVYGLGADALNAAAVTKIFLAKGRPVDHPLIVHLPDFGHLERWAQEVPDAARKLAQRFWPGPLTLILKRTPQVPDIVTGRQDTVGLRVPGHPLALELLAAFGSGVAAPSANRFGRISPTTAAHVHEELGDKVALILDGGPCRVGIESTILDLSRGIPVVLRPGAIGEMEIQEVIGEMPRGGLREVPGPHLRTAPRASGTLETHYAPWTPLRLVTGDELPKEVENAMAAGKRIGVLAMQQPSTSAFLASWRIMAPDPAGYAHELYAALREKDAQGLDLILVEAPLQTEDWAAVADRLARAAAGAGH